MWDQTHLSLQTFLLCTGTKMDEEPQGERGEVPRKGPPLPMSEVSASWGPVVHTLPIALWLLSLRWPAGRPVLPPGALLSVPSSRANQCPWEEQGLQGKISRYSVCVHEYICVTSSSLSHTRPCKLCPINRLHPLESFVTSILHTAVGSE